MALSHSQQPNFAELIETIQNLELQVSELKARLEKVEELPSALKFSRSDKGNATFLGTKYQKPEVTVDAVKTSRNGQFLGSDYTVTDAQVNMKSDGTKRTFLGREFSGKTLDQ